MRLILFWLIAPSRVFTAEGFLGFFRCLGELLAAHQFTANHQAALPSIITCNQGNDGLFGIVDDLNISGLNKLALIDPIFIILN